MAIIPGAPVVATNVMAVNVTGRTAVIMWTISRVTFTPEEYVVYYSLSSDSLTMTSEVLYGSDLEAVSVTYKVTLSELEQLSTYYYQVVSSNSLSSSSTAVLNFTTMQDGKILSSLLLEKLTRLLSYSAQWYTY